MKHTTRHMIPLVNSYQDYKNFKFNQSMKSFKRNHPYINIKAPRMKKDRNPPPHLNKENWIAKTEKEILRIDIQYPLQVENDHFTCWKKFREQLKKKLINQGLDIHIWIVDKNDLINVPHNLVQYK